jgi:hypothetical protein
MSFICDRCRVRQPAHSKPTRVVTGTRPKQYSARYREGVLIDGGGSGTEIVREENLCAKCASRTKSKFILPE